MHVHVERARLDGEIDDGKRVASTLEAAAVALLEGEGEGARGDRPAVDGEQDPLPVAAAQLRLRDGAGDRRPVEGQHLPGRRPTIDGGEGGGQTRPRRLEGRPALDQRSKAQPGVEEGELLDDLQAGGCLRRLALEELEPGGCVGEEVADLDHRARRRARRTLLEDPPGAQVDPAARARALDVGDGGDARQRLAPEAERRDRLEVGEGGDLAGRVALKSERELVGRDSAAVVDDPDQVAPRAAHLDADPPRTRVESVLDQLLDDRGRALHHLAGGDRVGDLGRQQPDRHESRDFIS